MKLFYQAGGYVWVVLEGFQEGGDGERAPRIVKSDVARAMRDC